MSNIPVYMDFLKGNLDSEAEQKFAEEFTYNEGFRSGFRNYLAVTGTINTNINKFGPPSRVTNALYSSLGFQIPPATAAIHPAQKVPAVKTKLFSNIVTSIITTIIAGFTVFLVTKPSTEALFGNQAVSAVTSITKNNLPFEKIDQSAGTITKPQIKYIYIDRQKQELERNRIPEPEIINNINVPDDRIIAQVDIQQLDWPINSENIINKHIPRQLEQVSIANLRTESGNSKQSRFSVEVRHSFDWNLPQETVDPVNISKFNNMGIALQYDLSEYFKAGLDLRQENFFVKYKGIDSLGRIILYEQQPNFTSCGAVLRYIPGIEIFGFSPSLQLTAGMNKYGIVTRSSIGVEYDLTAGFNFILQAELSYLIYKHQQSWWFSTSKIGLNSGFNYHF